MRLRVEGRLLRAHLTAGEVVQCAITVSAATEKEETPEQPLRAITVQMRGTCKANRQWLDMEAARSEGGVHAPAVPGTARPASSATEDWCMFATQPRLVTDAVTLPSRRATRRFMFEAQLPPLLPPSFRGEACGFVYSVVIAVQRGDGEPKHLVLPFYVQLPSDGAANHVHQQGGQQRKAGVPSSSTATAAAAAAASTQSASSAGFDLEHIPLLTAAYDNFPFRINAYDVDERGAAGGTGQHHPNTNTSANTNNANHNPAAAADTPRTPLGAHAHADANANATANADADVSEVTDPTQYAHMRPTSLVPSPAHDYRLRSDPLAMNQVSARPPSPGVSSGDLPPLRTTYLIRKDAWTVCRFVLATQGPLSSSAGFFGLFDFADCELPCYQVSMELVQIEAVPQPRVNKTRLADATLRPGSTGGTGSNGSHGAQDVVVAEHAVWHAEAYTHGAPHHSVSGCVPLHAPPSFRSQLVSVTWELRIVFYTSVKTHADKTPRALTSDELFSEHGCVQQLPWSVALPVASPPGTSMDGTVLAAEACAVVVTHA